jgi:hypothetical protein
MNANMGQANYCGANSFLDKIVHFEVPVFQSTALMWGAVGNIGMRWKAFATADFLNATPEALLSINDCQKILVAACVWLDPPEWFNCQHFDQFTREAIIRLTANFGSGGGYRGNEDAAYPSIPREYSRKGGNQASSGKEKADAPLGGWPGLLAPIEKEPAAPKLAEGARVRLVGVGAKDGKLGVALSEVEGGRWKVWLDQGGGNCILKTGNLEVVEASTNFVAGQGMSMDLSKCLAPLGPKANEEQPEDFRIPGKKCSQASESEAERIAKGYWRSWLGGHDSVIEALAATKAEVVEPVARPAAKRCD